MKILITGSSGFIGMHASLKLLQIGYDLIGIDNMNDYYDISLKEARLKLLKESYPNFNFQRLDIQDTKKLKKLFENHKFDIVINLAAQAGVRYSITNPQSYLDTNIQGFLNILEMCRNYKIKHLIYASSSSVYGLNTKLPFSENDKTDCQASFYGVTKKTNELMAHSYAHLYGLPSTGLRFFTVYGPWGRPDMALFSFTKSILNNEPIKVFNNGNMFRDFTYIDDIVESIVRLSLKSLTQEKLLKKPNLKTVPHNLFNIGNNNSILLLKYIEELEKVIGKKAKKIMLPAQQGDVIKTESNTNKLFQEISFKPKTSIRDGITNFVEWYKKFYNV